MFGVKIRVVDTAGIEDFEENKKNKDIINKTIEQTRKGLIFSDLALFLIDARQGITFTDIKLANWINKIKKSQIEKDSEKLKQENEELIKNKEEETTDEENKDKNTEDSENINSIIYLF